MTVEIKVEEIILNTSGPTSGPDNIEILSDETILNTESDITNIVVTQEIAQGSASAISFTPVGTLITSTNIQEAMEEVVTRAYTEVSWQYHDASFSALFSSAHIIDPPAAGLTITLPNTDASSNGLFILVTVITDPTTGSPIVVNNFGGAQEFILESIGTYYLVYHTSAGEWVRAAAGQSSTAIDIPIDLSSATPPYMSTNVKDAVLEVIEDAKEVDGGTF